MANTEYNSKVVALQGNGHHIVQHDPNGGLTLEQLCAKLGGAAGTTLANSALPPSIKAPKPRHRTRGYNGAFAKAPDGTPESAISSKHAKGKKVRILPVVIILGLAIAGFAASKARADGGEFRVFIPMARQSMLPKPTAYLPVTPVKPEPTVPASSMTATPPTQTPQPVAVNWSSRAA